MSCLVTRLHDLRGELQNAITETWSRGDLKFVSLDHYPRLSPLVQAIPDFGNSDGCWTVEALAGRTATIIRVPTLSAGRCRLSIPPRHA